MEYRRLVGYVAYLPSSNVMITPSLILNASMMRGMAEFSSIFGLSLSSKRKLNSCLRLRHFFEELVMSNQKRVTDVLLFFEAQIGFVSSRSNRDKAPRADGVN
jgi:hypothetical protein